MLMMLLPIITFGQTWEFNKTKWNNTVTVGKTPVTVTLEDNILKVEYHKRHHQQFNLMLLVEEMGVGIYSTPVSGKHFVIIKGDTIEITGVHIEDVGIRTVTLYNK